jgi:hypothetical protein
LISHLGVSGGSLETIERPTSKHCVDMQNKAAFL